MIADGELYAGTVSDFSGLDPLIYKDPLRTEQYDFKHLNGTQFQFNHSINQLLIRFHYVILKKVIYYFIILEICNNKSN